MLYSYAIYCTYLNILFTLGPFYAATKKSSFDVKNARHLTSRIILISLFTSVILRAGASLCYIFPVNHFSRPKAYAFGREMVCSQKSVRNRNFFENAGHVSFSFCQTGSAETHTKPCKTSPQGTSIKRPAIYWDHAVSWGGGGVGLALAILVGLAKKWDCAAFLYISCQPFFTT